MYEGLTQAGYGGQFKKPELSPIEQVMNQMVAGEVAKKNLGSGGATAANSTNTIPNYGIAGSSTGTSLTTPLTTTAPAIPSPTELGQQQGQYSTAALNSYAGMPVIQSGLKGQLAPDVLSNIYQGGAELGAARGMAPGSQATNAAILKNIGLTSYGVQQDALKNLNAAYGNFAKLDPMAQANQSMDVWKENNKNQLVVWSQLNSQDFKAALQADAHQFEMGMQALKNNLALSMQDRELAMQRLALQYKDKWEQAAQDAQSKGDSAAAQFAQSILNNMGKTGTTAKTANNGWSFPQEYNAMADWDWYEGGGGLPESSSAMYLNENGEYVPW